MHTILNIHSIKVEESPSYCKFHLQKECRGTWNLIVLFTRVLQIEKKNGYYIIIVILPLA